MYKEYSQHKGKHKIYTFQEFYNKKSHYFLYNSTFRFKYVRTNVQQAHGLRLCLEQEGG